jgi:hypothetical protein
LETEIPPPSSGDITILIGPDGGNFQDDMFAGGGEEQATIETAVEVAIFSSVQLDPTGHDQETLSNESNGVLKILDRVLIALTGHDLLVGDNQVLRFLLHPQGFHRPRRVPPDLQRVASIAVVFSVSFDWALT